jgi:hypothetical protein
MHQVQSGWVKRIAAEVAEEVGVLLQDHDLNSGTREKKSEHQAGWSSAGDAATGLNVLCQFASWVP